MKCAFKLLIVISAFTLLSSVALAGSSQFLVDSAWLSQHRGKVVLVDVRDRNAYMEEHIADAINIPVNDLQSNPDEILYPVPQLEKILSERGLDINKEVVLYGTDKVMAHLEFWMLDYLGMQKLHVLDGGIDEGTGGLSTAEVKLPPAVFRAKPNPDMYAITSYVKASLRTRNRHKILLDVRTPEEYRGVDVRSLRGGHIPGAINLNVEENYQEGSVKLKSKEELAKLYDMLDKKKEIIVYCQTGTRAAVTYFVLRHLLGFPKVRVYDASWIEWGTRLDLPVDDVSYFNFVTLINENKKLQKEIEGLKAH